MPPSAVSPGTEGLLSPSTQQPACEHTPERGTGPPGTYAHLQEPVASVRGTGPPEADCLPCHGHICHGGFSVFSAFLFLSSFSPLFPLSDLAGADWGLASLPSSAVNPLVPIGSRLGTGFLAVQCCHPWHCRSSLSLHSSLHVSILRRGVPVPPEPMLTCRNQSLR